MAEFVFTSPGVKFKERDLTYVTRNVGITTLGVVGETLKGPAFEPVFIQDKGQFQTRFGNQSTKRFSNGQLQYQLPYVANAYLDESQQLWVTRVLGLSGYGSLNNKAWAITLSAGVDTSTAVAGTPVVFPSVPFGTPIPNQYLGVVLAYSGATGSLNSGYTKDINTGIFTNVVHEFTAITKTITGGTVRDIETTYTATGYTEYENMVLAVVRSRGDSNTANLDIPRTSYDTKILTLSDNMTINPAINPTGDLFASFNLTATNAGVDPLTGDPTGSTEVYGVSLNPNDSSFLPNVVGYEPKDKNTKIWVQSIYPDLIKKLDNDGIAYGINTQMITATTANYFDYKTAFKTPETPWVVSQLKGSSLDRLFRFISVSDGDAANQEIKITIGNIKPDTLEFDVVIREFYDTDANPNVLETFQKCTMVKGTSSYIGQRIGTSDGEYTLNSKYVMVEIADDIPLDVFPAGFEGYRFNNYDSNVTGCVISGRTPAIFYKTEYLETDKIAKTYLGVSETAYVGNSGINQNFFNFNNYYEGRSDGETGFTKTKGFHMDSGATGIYNGFEFEVGAGRFRTFSDVDTESNPYYLLKTRKFTLVPAGGFDGWDVYRNARSTTDGYQQGGMKSGYPGQPLVIPSNDFQAWEMAADTFSNPENVTINLFATPGINWMEQTILVQNMIEMIEEQRTDTLYIIDSPELKESIAPSLGGSGKEDVVVAEFIGETLDDAEIDSSYSCTYFPWIQMRDTQNNVNVYIPPTGEVAKAMAFTDNTKFPWFAPAGLNRGVTNARKSMFKLSLEARDTLYSHRINPMADFADAGTAIFGQKTLQVKESALDRINVRRLLLQIKVLIANIAIRLVFEQNDQATIDQFLAKANPILDSIKRERGLVDFRIKMDDSNNTPETRDRNELYGEIFLKPTRAVEFIGITFTITPSGASFSDVGA